MDNYERDKKQAIKALSKIKADIPFGDELFRAISRLSIGVPLEAVVFRRKKNEIYVLLVRRAKDDPAYPGAWHVPGTFLRPSETQDTAIKRLGKKELGCELKISRQVGWDDNLYENRGHCIHLIFLVKIRESIKNGRWFPVKKLPPEILDHHKNVVIPKALKTYKATKK